MKLSGRTVLEDILGKLCPEYQLFLIFITKRRQEYLIDTWAITAPKYPLFVIKPGGADFSGKTP